MKNKIALMVSIVICTYNRSRRLRKVLQSLEEMIVPTNILLEIIVVDNNSNDNTKEVVVDYLAISKLSIRYIFERNQGMSFVRNRGIIESKGSIVSFTDDDCITDKYWIENVVNEFLSDSSIAAVVGRVELYNKEDKKISTLTYGERVVFSHFDQISYLVIRCNMSLHRRLFDSVGYFDIRFGVGSQIPSAEDWDFIYNSYKKGFKIVYSPRALIYHDHGRKRDDQVRELMKNYTVGRWAFYFKHIIRGDIDIAKLGCSEIYSIIRIIMKSIYTKTPFDKQKEDITAIFLGLKWYIKACMVDKKIRWQQLLRGCGGH